MNHMTHVFDFAHSQRRKLAHPIPLPTADTGIGKEEASGKKSSLLSEPSRSTLTLVKISLKAILF